MKEPARDVDELYLVTPRQRRQGTSRRANAKIEDVRERLRALAREKGPGNQLPTIRELCTLFSTSSATLTTALDQLETEHVLCRKERQGVFVSDTIHQGLIHIVFNVSGLTDTGTSPFWSLLWGHLVQETEHRATFKNEQYRFHFLCRPYGLPLPEDYIALLHSPQVGGCLLIGANAHAPDHTKLLHVPHVAFAAGGDITVQVDDQEKVSLAARALIQQGCRRIACWQPLWKPGEYEYELLQEDSKGLLFKEALSQQKIPVHPELFRCAPTSLISDKKIPTLQEQGYLLAKEVFGSSNEKPDGVYITDDMLTSGALIAWEELGLHVGKDFKVATHANAGSPILFGKTKLMAVIEFDPADLARAMFSLLDTAMMNSYTPEDRVVPIRPRLRL